jgi:hypothetical protein
MATNPEPTSTAGDAKVKLTSGLLYIAQISGIITVIAATVYVLGLFALLLPMLNKYDVSFHSAWYMVSLMPKTVIAGYGVKSLVWPALLTVVPIAFIVVMTLTLVSILVAGARSAQYQANAAEKGELSRIMLFIMAVYLVYSAVLGVVLLAVHNLVKDVDSSFLQDHVLPYHVVAGALAYAVFALLCLLTLALFTWRAGRYVTRLIRTRDLSYQLLKELGSVKVSLYLALSVGMCSAVGSSWFLVGPLIREIREGGASPGPVFAAWKAVLLSLIALVPVVLILLLLSRVFSSELLDKLGPTLGTLGSALKVFLSIVVIGAALVLIVGLFIFEILVEILPRDHLLLQVSDFGSFYAFFLLLSLFIMVMLLWPVGKAIRLEALKGAGAKLRFGFIAVAVAGAALLSGGSVRVDVSQNQSLSAAVMPVIPGLLFFAIFGGVVASLLMLQGGRYIARIIMKRTTVTSTPARDFRSYLAKRVEHLRTKSRQLVSGVDYKLTYAGILFATFYLVLLIIFLYGRYLIWPLIDNINSVASSQSPFDQLYLVLTIVGGIVSGVFLYKGLFRSKQAPAEEDLFSAKNWQSFSKCLWETTRPRPKGRWVARSLTGAYVFSVFVASLLAYLEEPPLPHVEVQEIQEGKSIKSLVSTSTEEPGFQSSTKSLLAHTDGFWYLLDEDDGDLVIIPDQRVHFLQLPKYVESVDKTRALKVAVPSAWDESLSAYPPGWQYRPVEETSRLTVSANVDNWGDDYVTPGTFIEAYSPKEWTVYSGSPVASGVVEAEAMRSAKRYKKDCGLPDRYLDDFDLEDEQHLYTAKITRWRPCDGDEEGGYFVDLWAVPKDRSFVLNAQIQFPRDNGTTGTDYDEEADRILRSIEVRAEGLP